MVKKLIYYKGIYLIKFKNNLLFFSDYSFFSNINNIEKYVLLFYLLI